MWSPLPKPSDFVSPSGIDSRFSLTSYVGHWRIRHRSGHQNSTPSAPHRRFFCFGIFIQKAQWSEKTKNKQKIRAMPGASPSKSRYSRPFTLCETRDLLASGLCASSSDRSHRLHDSNVQMLSYLSALREAFVRRSITRRSTSVRGRASYAMNYSPISLKCQSKPLSPTLFSAFCTSQLVPECSILPLFCPQSVFRGSIDNFLV